MRVMDDRRIFLPNGAEYENCIEDGKESEWLDGVGLKNGCYCKHYCRRRDWHGESLDRGVLDEANRPVEQHYCLKARRFMGFAYCCSSHAKCFEEGKSAGVKRLLNKICKERGYVVEG